jgi:hypothetical protein
VSLDRITSVGKCETNKAVENKKEAAAKGTAKERKQQNQRMM